MPHRTRRCTGLTAALLALPALALAGGCTGRTHPGPGDGAGKKPEEVVALLGIDAGDRVADLGAGGDAFTFRLADAVGPEGRVYAVDVDPDRLASLAARVREEDRRNVVVVRATAEDPGLPEGEIDLVFLSGTYHRIEDRPYYFHRLLGDLAPNGRVAVIERDERAGITRDRITREMQEAGYEPVADHPILDRRSFLIFRPDDGTGE